jgi:dihydrodiol dehydrogenase / D-xylose 1-dehydrogenase (NADP)
MAAMSEAIRWGILGAGRIARKFAASLRELPEAELVAVGSRSAERAQALAEEFAVPHRHDTYEALAQNPAIQVVYVATRHPAHLEAMRWCLLAGKPVLCEKPFTLNAAEAEEAIARARARRVFLMEAMWTRFFPAMERVREWVCQGRIGEPRLLQGNFGFLNDWKPAGRHLNLALGGGALLDVGVYLVSLSSAFFGPPESMASEAVLGSTGVDESCGLVLRHRGGGLSVLAAAIRTDTRKDVVLHGTEGRIEIDPPFWKPAVVKLFPLRGEPERVELPFPNFGYQFEAAHVMRCLREGRTESPTMPLEETLSIMRTLDAARAPWGLKYPGER